jgi:hypothetical protein
MSLKNLRRSVMSRHPKQVSAVRHTCRNASIAASIFIFAILVLGCCTPTPPPSSQFSDDWTGLFLAVTKSLGARTYYIGSDDQWSYFQTEFEKSVFTPTYRKIQTSSVRLRRTFPVRQGVPYRVELSDFGCDKDCHPL